MAARFLVHSAASARVVAGIAGRQSRTIASTAFLRHKESAVRKCPLSSLNSSSVMPSPLPSSGNQLTEALGSTDHNLEDPSTQEKHKQDLLSKQKSGKGEWKPELASDSEEAVRAERDPADPQELQKRTKAAAEKQGQN